METEVATGLGNQVWEQRGKVSTGGFGALASGPVGMSLADSPRSTAGDICPVEMWQRPVVEAGPSHSLGGRSRGQGREPRFCLRR